MNFYLKNHSAGAALRSIRFPVLAILLLACALAGCARLNPGRNFAPPAEHEPDPQLTAPADILAALRRGGYVIYMRHGRTNRDELELEQKNRAAGKFTLADCATQRNLSAEGRAEAHAAGQQFRRLRLPIARVEASRYCRVVQTVREFADQVAWSEALTSDGPAAQAPERVNAVRALLSEPPPPGSNTLLVAHQGIFYEATRLTVQEGWAVVLEPGEFRRIVARIAPADWGRMAGPPEPKPQGGPDGLSATKKKTP